MRPLLLATVAGLLQLQQSGAPSRARTPREVAADLPRARWVQDMRSKNLEDVLSLYTADAIFVQPDGKKIDTPAALRRLYEQVFAVYDSDISFGRGGFSLEDTDTAPRSIATQSGEYRENLTTRATKQVQQVCGRYLFVWRLQADGRWLLSRMEWTLGTCSPYTL